MTRNSRYTFQLLFLILLILILIILDVSIGTIKISPREILSHIIGRGEVSQQHLVILRDFRIPRILTALLAGAALAVSGLQMQTIFRNPLAGPYILGVSSGASLGAALVVLGSGAATAGILSSLGLAFAAWLGAAAVMVLLLLVSLRIKNIMTILILGIMFSSGLSAVIAIMQYFGTASALKSFVIWSMGSLGAVTNSSLLVLAAAIIPGLLLAMFSVKGLNSMMLGEEYASSVGVNLRLIRILVFASTSILAGSVTAFCGPIGFIGIAVPHITRFIIGRSDLRYLFPATLLCGIAMLLVSDLVSQLPGSERILPLNAVTSLIGIPVVVWVVIRGRKMTS